MRQADDGGGVKGGVDGAEAEDLGLCAAGGGAAQAGPDLAQDGIALVPEIAGRSIAEEENFGSRGGPVESVAELVCNGGQIGGVQASAVGKAVAAMHPGPETAIGKTVLCFRAVEMVSKLTLSYVGNEADMGSGGAQLLLHIERREMATIPGAAEKG